MRVLAFFIFMSRRIKKGRQPRKPILERFLSKAHIGNGCWIWSKSTSYDHYGNFNWSHRQDQIGAHVASYRIYIGDIPKGLFVCHSCDNKSCVSPFHLFLGTHSENLKDARDKGIMPSAIHPSRATYDKGCRCPECLNIENTYQRSRWGEDKIRKQQIYRAKRKLLAANI